MKAGIFIIGTVVGAAGAATGVYLRLKKLYSARLEQEVASVREAYTKEIENLMTQLKEKSETVAEVEEQKDILEERKPPSPVETKPIVAEKPYIITEEEYEKNEYGYFQESLNYYTDNVVANISDEIVKPEDTIGLEALRILDEDPVDKVFVRNERLELEWEITNDPRTYHEVTENWLSDEVDDD